MRGQRRSTSLLISSFTPACLHLISQNKFVMHFRLKTFMPFAILGTLLVLLAITTPPYIYADKEFMSGKSIERELRTMRHFIGEGGDMHPSAGAELPAHLSRIEDEVDTILDSSRWRQLWGSSLLIASAGAVVILAGLFTTVIVSWKTDVSMLQAKQQAGELEMATPIEPSE